MRLFLGLLASGLLAVSAWHYGPEEALTAAMTAVTPCTDTLQDVHQAIAVLINSFDGPGEIAPGS
ncbi:hypothetical protein F1654_13750 [Alkalicaulis satelles]|uniref:Uncharacterized protein n=1 Tax=Alkalicaulis satelles TaxID=2609175 RepID=A0A5M6Z8F7_9PROT|nr:hypothetical protein [Alkalicaulis satelles]KAA5800899.1 hypothetical protein F1654_13750 [Alkalicaulis satelles]